MANIGPTLSKYTGAAELSALLESDKFGIVSVKTYGAVGDGVTDDTVAIQTAVATKKQLYFPKGTYLINDVININYSGVFDFNYSKFIGNGYFLFEGTFENLGNILSSSANKGDSSLSITDSDFKITDLIILHNTSTQSFSSHRDYYYDGEFVEVVSSNSTTVNLKSTLKTNYSSISNIDVIKVNPITVDIRNVEFETDGSLSLKLSFCKNSSVSNVFGYSTGVYGLYIDRCYFVGLHNINFYQNAESTSGTDYAVIIGNSQKITFNNGDLYALRHAFATGGADLPGCVPCRELLIENVNGFSTDSHSIDCHGNVEGIIFNRCNAYNGYGFGGKDITITNCYVERNDGTIYSPILITEFVGGDVVLENINCKLYSVSFLNIQSTINAGKAKYSYYFKVKNINIDCNSIAEYLFVLGNYADPNLVSEWGHEIDTLNLKNSSSVIRICSHNHATTAEQLLQPNPAKYLKLNNVNMDSKSSLIYWIYSDLDGFTTGTIVTSPKTFEYKSVTLNNGDYISTTGIYIQYPITLNIIPPIKTSFNGSGVLGTAFLFPVLTGSTTSAANIFLGTAASSITVGAGVTKTLFACTDITDYVI